MFKTMLVPLDGSETAEMALPFVEEIATSLSAEVVLVSVFEPADPHMERLHQSYLDRVTAKVQKELEHWEAPKSVWVSNKALSGNPVEKILQYADEGDVSCIAMASHGSSSHGLWGT